MPVGGAERKADHRSVEELQGLVEVHDLGKERDDDKGEKEVHELRTWG